MLCSKTPHIGFYVAMALNDGCHHDNSSPVKGRVKDPVLRPTILFHSDPDSFIATTGSPATQGYRGTVMTSLLPIPDMIPQKDWSATGNIKVLPSCWKNSHSDIFCCFRRHKTTPLLLK
jgi:hypothetical protein